MSHQACIYFCFSFLDFLFSCLSAVLLFSLVFEAGFGFVRRLALESLCISSASTHLTEGTVHKHVCKYCI